MQKNSQTKLSSLTATRFMTDLFSIEIAYVSAIKQTDAAGEAAELSHLNQSPFLAPRKKYPQLGVPSLPI